ncbi:MAG: TIGR00725 family protein [Candidatus Omnitrophica bacterium]|nr:TIGR00725 family protein [Candidatus Omnitrophota bacterium]MBU2265632.1 TIGR00725 family protein [Candidatus Omnitrophota bacterium]
MKNEKINVAVVGGHRCSKKIYNLAYSVGQLIARQGWILICGGRTGVMEAACKGVKQAKGLTVGILPSYNGKDANPYLDVKIPTGLGFARNALVVRAAEAVIAFTGKEGTLSEIGFALSEKKPVVGIETWDIEGVIKASSAKDAIAKVKAKLHVK